MKSRTWWSGDKGCSASNKRLSCRRGTARRSVSDENLSTMNNIQADRLTALSPLSPIAAFYSATCRLTLLYKSFNR